MLLQHFGFKEEPFGVNPDPRCLYLSRTHQQALEALEFGFSNNRGFTAMIAPPGMGKTTLLFRFLEDIRDSARVVFLFDIDPQCEPREFVAYILRDLDIVPAHGSAEMHDQLSNAVIKENRAGRKFVIVIDEAQNLSEAVLERVRLLTNFETSRGKLIQIVLSGQTQLSEKLLHASLVQLRQRISTVCHIESLSAEETVGYIDYRVKMAGYLGQPLFTAGAVRFIAEASHGTPRTINNLCFNALALCAKMNLRQVDAAMVSKVIAGLQLVPQSSAPIETPAAAPIAAPAVPVAAAPIAMAPVAAAPERPKERRMFAGLQLIPSTYEPAAPAIAPVAVSSGESPDQPTERKFWERTKLRLIHLLPATSGSVMLWVPSAAIILVVTFLGVLRLTELWAPQIPSTFVDQSTVLDAPPPAPAPDTDEPAATESTSPSDPGSPIDKPSSAPAAAPKPLQANASIPKPSPATALPASTSRQLHANASNPKPAAAVAQPAASTAKEPSASKPIASSASIPMPSAAAQPVVTPAAPAASAANPVAAQHSSTPAAPAAAAPKQVRAALTANAPIAAQPSAEPSVRPALPPLAP
ncbi:MAG: AAA family ATPase [Terracidiphilus sp.]|jgi:general secretion pathway protein A